MVRLQKVTNMVNHLPELVLKKNNGMHMTYMVLIWNIVQYSFGTRIFRGDQSLISTFLYINKSQGWGHPTNHGLIPQTQYIYCFFRKLIANNELFGFTLSYVQMLIITRNNVLVFNCLFSDVRKLGIVRDILI